MVAVVVTSVTCDGDGDAAASCAESTGAVTPMYGHDVAVTLYGAGLGQIGTESAIAL